VPTSIFSSLFGQNNRVGSHVPPPRNPTSVIELVNRVGSCTTIRTNNCLGNEKDETEKHSNRLRYVVTDVERSNSMVESMDRHRPPKPRAPTASTKGASPNKSTSPSARMGKKKSTAYRAYMHKKMTEREEECLQPLGSPIPMEIGVKRTFTDEKGRVREMVSL